MQPFRNGVKAGIGAGPGENFAGNWFSIVEVGVLHDKGMHAVSNSVVYLHIVHGMRMDVLILHSMHDPLFGYVSL